MNALIIFRRRSNSAIFARLAADHAHRRVAAADAHDHAAVGDVLQRRVGARRDRPAFRRVTWLVTR